MRVDAEPRYLEVKPGDTTAVLVDVANTDDVIDGFSTNVIGISQECVTATPALLPLFPDARGRVKIDLAVPPTHPAGRHPLTVEVVSHGTATAPNYVDIDLDVAAHPDMRAQVRPRLIRAHRGARYLLEVVNNGNVPLDVTLTGSDPDRHVAVKFSPDRRRVEPGTVAPILVSLRGPRMFTGPEIDRTVVIEVNARPIVKRTAATAETAAAAHPNGAGNRRGPDVENATPSPSVIQQVVVSLRQRPLVSRGLLTALILVGIVALWAAIFLLGLGKVFAADPMTKQAPASFFASLNSPSPTAAATAPFRAGSGTQGSGSGAAPAGALPKSGQLPPGMGGEINGTVVAADDGQAVGRILVVAYRQSTHGLVAMSSGATQTDGTYALAGLFPTSYYLKFSAAGYQTVWYPNRPSQTGSQPVTTVAAGITSNINATIAGRPASISGKVDPGDTLTPVKTTVTARPLLGPKIGIPIASATTNSAGTYVLRNLPAPNSYQLTYTTAGYQESTLVDSVDGGDQRLEPVVILGASTGTISGIVTDGKSGLGGATIHTTVGGLARNLVTPTTGQVGAYVLSNLPTPATYVITYSSPGHGTTTQIVDLAAGQSRNALNVSLTSGTGSISGIVLGPDGHGLGNATVSIGGAVTNSGHPPTATTLTEGIPGSFAINNLAASGSYTLTVTHPGYAPASVPVTLTGNGAPPNVTIRLTAQAGRIAGIVRSANGRPLSGATVTATNGQQSLTTTSNSADGGYLIDNVQPGSYSVTVTAPGQRQETALVTVVVGATTRQNLQLGG